MTSSVTRLKDLLHASGMIHVQLAEMCYLSPSTVNYIVNGKAIPNLRTAQRIAYVLHTTTDYLWPFKPEEEQ